MCVHLGFAQSQVTHVSPMRANPDRLYGFLVD